MRNSYQKRKIEKVFMFKKSEDITSYWDNRYTTGSTSGAGSYGEESKVKADYVNNAIKENQIKTLLELGCGDGNQLSMFEIEKYIGLDISPRIITKCKEKFAEDKTKIFRVYDINTTELKEDYDMIISLDVIFHLVIEEAFKNYMGILFNDSNYVLIYTMRNIKENQIKHAPHVKFRDINAWVEENIVGYELLDNTPAFNKEFLLYKKK